MDNRFPSFEAYVEAEHGSWTKPGKCRGCLRKAPRLTNGSPVGGGRRTGEGYCEWCIRYMYGYDQAEASVADALIGGAVRGALEAEIDPELIVRAVHRAIEQDHNTQIDQAWTRYAKAVAP